MMKLIAIWVLSIVSTNLVHASCIFKELSTQFDNLNHSEIIDFSVNQYQYSANYSGGLVRNDNESYWAVLPLGVTEEGNSNGSAVISLNPGAKALSASFLAGDDMQARIQLVGETDDIINEYSFVNGESLDLDIQYDDMTPLVSAINVIVDGGTDAIQLHSFSYYNESSNKPCNDTPSVATGAFNFCWLGIMLAALSLIRFSARARLLNRYNHTGNTLMKSKH